MWDKFYTIATGGCILILSVIINDMMKSLMVDNSFVSLIGYAVVCVVVFFVMGRVSDNIVRFFKELAKNEKRG
jgi:predicted PurR-regulated permease PerM